MLIYPVGEEFPAAENVYKNIFLTWVAKKLQGPYKRGTNYEKYIFYHSLLKLAWRLFAFTGIQKNF